MLDLKKAFDTVNHPILLPKLNSLWNETNAYKIELLSSYLDNGTQKCAVNSFLSKSCTLTCGIPQKDQMNMLRSFKKLNFCSTFKNDVSRSEYLDLIKNEKHRQAVAKLRSSNHRLRIETDRYHLPKIPENLRICQLCSSNKVENEICFLLELNL